MRNNRETISIEAAKGRDVTSLRNWLNSSGSIAREERVYLSNDMDLMGLNSQNVDRALCSLQEVVEDCTKWLSRWTKVWDKTVSYNKISRNTKGGTLKITY